MLFRSSRGTRVVAGERPRGVCPLLSGCGFRGASLVHVSADLLDGRVEEALAALQPLRTSNTSAASAAGLYDPVVSASRDAAGSEPPFPFEEYAERMIRARAVLADAELDGCIVLGPDSQFWLSGLESFISGVLPQALVFSKDADEPTLVVWDADVPLARATS